MAKSNSKKLKKKDWIDRMSEDGAKDYLRTLVAKLDELDGEDSLGTEGWRHYLGMED